MRAPPQDATARATQMGTAPACALPNADVEVHVVPGVGHSVLRQAPGAAFALVRRFLKGLDTTG